jgi:hypothetical protein
MGIFKTLTFMPRMLRLNKDQKQQELAALFATAGESAPERAAQVAIVIEQFIKNEGWAGDEVRYRISHALSLVKVRATWDSEIFEKASLIGLDMIERLTAANQHQGREEMKAEFGTENLSPEIQEDIAKAIVALMEARRVRTHHAAIGILMLTVTVLMKQLPPSNHREQMRQAMLRWVEMLK